MNKSEALKIITDGSLPTTRFGCLFSPHAQARFPEKSPGEQIGYRENRCIGCTIKPLPPGTIFVITTDISHLVPRGPEMSSCQPLTE